MEKLHLVTPLFLMGPTNRRKEDSIFSIPNSRGQIVGTAYGEATGAPDGWADVLGQTEGYAQIFKTACPMMSGTAMATEYRGKKNEFQRIWDEKMREHKMDIEHAALFGVGHAAATASGAGPPKPGGRKGVHLGRLPFISLYGNTGAFSYAASGYNDFVDFTETFFAPENGNSMSKLVLASRKIIGWFSKLNQGFLPRQHPRCGSGSSGCAKPEVSVRLQPHTHQHRVWRTKLRGASLAAQPVGRPRYRVGFAQHLLSPARRKRHQPRYLLPNQRSRQRRRRTHRSDDY